MDPLNAMHQPVSKLMTAPKQAAATNAATAPVAPAGAAGAAGAASTSHVGQPTTTAAVLASVKDHQQQQRHEQLTFHSSSPRSHHAQSVDASAGHREIFPNERPIEHSRRATTGELNSTMFNDNAPKERIDIIADYLKDQTAYRPIIGVICGSGLGGLSKIIEKPDVIKYEDIPQFPKSTVEGHAGELVFGELGGFQVVCMRGRFHSYEGYDIKDTTLPVRVMYLLGVKYMIVTNAAGALNKDYNIGDVMILNDHLNMPGLAGKHPLVGPNDKRFGERFPAMSDCYREDIRSMAMDVAKELNLEKIVHQGVYCFVSGPSYETPTECRLLRLVGGDAVGMSTVPEVIVAHHCGMKVFSFSLITNKVVFPGEGGEPACHEEVLEAVKSIESSLQKYVEHIIYKMGAMHTAK